MKKKFKENPGIKNDELVGIQIDIPNNSKRSLIKNYRNTIQSRSSTPIMGSESEQVSESEQERLRKKFGINDKNENKPPVNDNGNNWER